eukprot:1158915-Pelagomonas_calceolata.AAC.3
MPGAEAASGCIDLTGLTPKEAGDEEGSSSGRCSDVAVVITAALSVQQEEEIAKHSLCSRKRDCKRLKGERLQRARLRCCCHGYSSALCTAGKNLIFLLGAKGSIYCVNSIYDRAPVKHSHLLLPQLIWWPRIQVCRLLQCRCQTRQPLSQTYAHHVPGSSGGPASRSAGSCSAGARQDSPLLKLRGAVEARALCSSWRAQVV